MHDSAEFTTMDNSIHTASHFRALFATRGTRAGTRTCTYIGPCVIKGVGAALVKSK